MRKLPAAVLLLGAMAPAQLQPTPLQIQVGTTFWTQEVDWDLDGASDFVGIVRVPNDHHLVLWSNHGGSFLPQVLLTGLRSDDKFAVADLNGDGLPDLAGARFGSVDVLLNGATTFLATPTPDVSREQQPVVGDFDEDGRPDLAVTLRLGNACFLRILSGNGDGTFTPVHTESTLGSLITAGDFDGDGHLDVAALGGLFLAIHWGDGRGSLSYPSIEPVQTRPGSPVVDIGRDGRSEILYAEAGVLFVYSFSPARQLVTRYFLGGQWDNRAIPTGDFNGDGWVDVVLYNFIGQSLTSLATLVPGTETGFGVPTVTTLQDRLETTATSRVRGRSRSELRALVRGSSNYFAFYELSAPSQPSLTAYGTGTQGCVGTATLGAALDPAIGSPEFAISTVGAPARSLGFLGISDTQDLTGSDPFGVGALLHVGTGSLAVYAFLSDETSIARAPLPIPNDPGLQGLTVYAQGFWLEEQPGFICSAARAGIVTSRGLSITIQ